MSRYGQRTRPSSAISTWGRGEPSPLVVDYLVVAGGGGGGATNNAGELRPGGGGGRSRVFQGKVIEKGGVNFSAVHGAMPEKISENANPELRDRVILKNSKEARR